MNTFLIISGILFVISFVAFFVINAGNKTMRSKKTIMFLLLFALIITVPACLCMVADVTGSTWWFILLQVFYLGLGILYYHLLSREYFGSFKEKTWSDLCLITANASSGYIGFVLVFNYFNDSKLAQLYGMSIIFFLVPLLFMSAFELMGNIPQAIYKIWYYPIDEEEPDYDNIDLNKIFFIELEFSKSAIETEIGNYKAKAPVDMVFKDWFRSFINNYNYKFEEDPIHYLNGNSEPFGWTFYTKPNLLQTKRFIDPELSIKGNKLNEKTVIIAKRVGISEN